MEPAVIRRKIHTVFEQKLLVSSISYVFICNREVEVARVSGSILKKRVLQLSVSFGVSGTEVIE